VGLRIARATIGSAEGKMTVAGNRSRKVGAGLAGERGSEKEVALLGNEIGRTSAEFRKKWENSRVIQELERRMRR
jgi:hypothetical protein